MNLAFVHIPETPLGSVLYSGIPDGYTSPVPTMQARLRYFREQAGLRQEDVAADLGIAQSTLSKWERGKSFPDLQQAAQLASMYGVTVAEFVATSQGRVSRPVTAGTEDESSKDSSATKGGIHATQPDSTRVRQLERKAVAYEALIREVENFAGELFATAKRAVAHAQGRTPEARRPHRGPNARKTRRPSTA